MQEIEKIVLSQVKSAIVPQHCAGARNLMEKRDSYGFSFSLGGEAVYVQNGESFVSDLNTLIIHPEGASYEMRCTKGGAFGLINFHTVKPFTDRFITVRITDTAYLEEKLAELKEALMLGQSGARAMRIVYEVIEFISTESKEGENAVVRKAVDLISQSYKEPDFTVGRLAGEIHVSESYLRRLFSQFFGVSPKKYLMRVRISRAKILLSEGRRSIGDIAAECGFVSVYNFSRAFRESTGKAPTDYRRTHRHRAQL